MPKKEANVSILQFRVIRDSLTQNAWQQYSPPNLTIRPNIINSFILTTRRYLEFRVDKFSVFVIISARFGKIEHSVHKVYARPKFDS